VAYAAAGGVYSVLVEYFGHEVRSGVDVAAVCERRRVEVAVERRADGVGAERARSAYDEVAVAAVHGVVRGRVERQHVNHARLVAVVNVLRHGEGEAEFAAAHAVVAVEEHRVAVVILERNACAFVARIVKFAHNQFFGVPHECRHYAVERLVLAAFGRLYVAVNLYNGACRELRQLAVGADGRAVNAVDYCSGARHVELQRRVAQQRVLQLVLASVGTGGHQLVLCPALGFAY